MTRLFAGTLRHCRTAPTAIRSGKVAVLTFLLAIALTPRIGSAKVAAARAQVTCRETLDSLDSKIRQNYAGFLLEVNGDRRAAYDQMLPRLQRRADSTALSGCYPILDAYTGWYDDPHLFVFQSQQADPRSADERRNTLRRVALTEADLRDSLAAPGRTNDPIEGVWYDGPLRIGVIRDSGSRSEDFIGVVLASDTVAWPVGAVRAQFRREGHDVYATRLLTREFAELQLTARIHKRTILRLSPGMWGRAFTVSAADSGLIDPVDIHRPVVSVRERSVVVSIPSHDPQQVRRLDSLIREHDAAIRARPLLIVDLRGDEGGSSFTSRALHPYIASAERRPTPFDSGAAVMLSSPAQIAYARRFTGTDTSAFVRSLVARLEANPGALVPLEEFPPGAPAPAPEPRVDGSWRVIVLIDGGTVSAAEVLVLRALRSTRAVVVGEPTAGGLDYQSVQIVSLGTRNRRWALGYPTIAVHAELPRRGMRGKGIQPELRLDWRAIADPIAELERRFAR